VTVSQWLAGPSSNQGVGSSIPALVDVSLSKMLTPEFLPVAASTVYECNIKCLWVPLESTILIKWIIIIKGLHNQIIKLPFSCREGPGRCSLEYPPYVSPFLLTVHFSKRGSAGKTSLRWAAGTRSPREDYSKHICSPPVRDKEKTAELQATRNWPCEIWFYKCGRRMKTGSDTCQESYAITSRLQKNMKWPAPP